MTKGEGREWVGELHVPFITLAEGREWVGPQNEWKAAKTEDWEGVGESEALHRGSKALLRPPFTDFIVFILHEIDLRSNPHSPS
jgi:hypothetical protein